VFNFVPINNKRSSNVSNFFLLWNYEKKISLRRTERGLLKQVDIEEQPCLPVKDSVVPPPNSCLNTLRM
jgi:hypothetical protein